MVYRDTPVVAGHVPVQLVVAVEEPYTVLNFVLDVDLPRGINSAWNVDLEVPIGSVFDRTLVFELLSSIVGDGTDFQEQRVISPMWPGVLDGQSTMDAMPLAEE